MKEMNLSWEIMLENNKSFKVIKNDFVEKLKAEFSKGVRSVCVNMDLDNDIETVKVSEWHDGTTLDVHTIHLNGIVEYVQKERFKVKDRYNCKGKWIGIEISLPIL